MLREQKAALRGYCVLSKGKGWWPDLKGGDWEERDDGGKRGGKEKSWRDGKAIEERAKPAERGKGSKEAKEEKEKTREGKGTKEVKEVEEKMREIDEKEASVEEENAQEECPPNPYRKGEIWWAPITDEEWKGWHGKETYKCKEGGWWTTMSDSVYERYLLMKELQ